MSMELAIWFLILVRIFTLGPVVSSYHSQVIFLVSPSGFFDLIIHNHVLEHLPGSYLDHINHFYRLLSQMDIWSLLFLICFISLACPALKVVRLSRQMLSDLGSSARKIIINGWELISCLISIQRSHLSNFIVIRERSMVTQMKAHNAVGIVFACRK